MSLEETLAILGTLGNLGIQGSEAGTALRRLLTLVQRNQKSFRRSSECNERRTGNARNLVDILGEVSAATANMAPLIARLHSMKSLDCSVLLAHRPLVRP